MAHSGARRLDDFITGCAEVSQADRLWDDAQAFFEAFGARRSIYLHLPPLHAAGRDTPELFARGCEPGLASAYRGGDLHRQDPVLGGALRGAEPLQWCGIHRLPSDTAAQRAVLGFYRDAGFASGLAVPVFGPGGRNGNVTIGFGSGGDAAEPGIDPDGVAPARLQAACQVAHLRHCALRQRSQPDPPKLSERERELLTWVARGKSNGVIAEIMRISPHTVDAYMRRVFLKLGTTDRISAALRALGEGLITGV
jgi:LuxR family transcriptional regulator/LuxR family quorum-sensing system transcriptional regulator CciR